MSREAATISYTPEIMPRRAAKAKHTLHVGSKVRLTFGVSRVTAVVVEDRGNVGAGGRHLWRVRLEIADTSEPIELEMPAEGLTALGA